MTSMWFLSWCWMMNTRNICGILSSYVYQIKSYRYNNNFYAPRILTTMKGQIGNAGWILLLGSFNSNMTKFNVKDMKSLTALHSWVSHLTTRIRMESCDFWTSWISEVLRTCRLRIFCSLKRCEQISFAQMTYNCFLPYMK